MYKAIVRTFVIYWSPSRILCKDDILVVQQVLRHASVNTTEVYAHLFNGTLEDALETL